jgi:hypothetical protein
MRGPAGRTQCSLLQVNYRILCHLLHGFMGNESILRQSEIIIYFSLSSFVLIEYQNYLILSLSLFQSQTNQPNILFFISVNQKDTRSGIVKSGKLVLVDLAGSEMVNIYINCHHYPPFC